MVVGGWWWFLLVVVGCRLLLVVVGCWSLLVVVVVVGCWLLVVGCWLLVVGCWLLLLLVVVVVVVVVVVGCWLLVVGGWWLVVGGLWLVGVVVVVVVVVGTNKDWGPQNKVPELILEFAWCPLRASLEFCTVLKKNFGADFCLLFFALSKLAGLLFGSFWRRKLAKRGPAGSLCSSVIFQVAGPLFGDPAAQVWQKGVPQPVRLEFHDPAFHFLAAGSFCVAGVLDPPKRGPAAPDFRFVSFSWCWTSVSSLCSCPLCL